LFIDTIACKFAYQFYHKSLILQGFMVQRFEKIFNFALLTKMNKNQLPICTKQ